MSGKIVLLSLIIGLFACQNQAELDKKLEDSKQKQILDIHDQLMSKMDKLETVKEKLKNTHFASNPHFKDNLKDTLIVYNTFQEAYKMLDSGNNSMMNWMQGFKMDYKGKTHEETMNYLNKQFIQVKAIDSMVSDGIKKADALLSVPK